jgi:hypothetical protein
VSAEARPRLLVITPCAASKWPRVQDPPTYEDLVVPERRAAAWSRLEQYARPARDLYTGRHHLAVLRVVDRLRTSWPYARCDIVIISAGYGVLHENDPVIPYDATFEGLPAAVAHVRAETLGIRRRLMERLARYDLAVFLLSKAYLEPLTPPLAGAPQELYFAASMFALHGEGVLQVPAGVPEARALKVSPRMVKAALLERFVEAAVTEGLPAAVGRAASGDLLQPIPPRPTQQLTLIDP